jgi:hypothetical protein
MRRTIIRDCRVWDGSGKATFPADLLIEGGRRGLDSALLIEHELFAQKEILGCERALDRKLRTKKRSKSAKRFSQSKQDFIMDRCLLFSVSLSNWSI